MASPAKEDLIRYVLRMGDNAVILGQQNGVWCGHAPVLEEDIAIANLSLDLIGQAMLWLGYGAELAGEGSADTLAFLRDEREYTNVLLVEQPNSDFAIALMRQFLFDCWHYPMLQELTASSDPEIAGIAAKAVKEVSYHLDRSKDVIVRLGDGSAESKARMQTALDALWRFTGELTEGDDLDDLMYQSGVGADMAKVGKAFQQHAGSTLDQAGLVIPENAWMQSGGKSGLHSEHMGPLLAEMQFMQRAYPGLKW